MKLKQNKSIHFESPHFVVDEPVNKKLQGYDVLDFLNRASANAFIGTSGSGKTSLVYSLLTHNEPRVWKKQYEEIIVVMPVNSRASLKSNLFDKHLKADDLYDSLTEESVEGIVSSIERNAGEKKRTLLILDDVAHALKSPYIVKRLQYLTYTYRHLRLTINFLVQTLRTIPLSIRKNLSNLIIFYRPRPSEWDAIVEEFLELDKPESAEIFKLGFREKYDWVLVNLTTGRIFKKFDEIIREDA